MVPNELTGELMYGRQSCARRSGQISIFSGGENRDLTPDRASFSAEPGGNDMGKRRAFILVFWLAACVGAFAQATSTINGRIVDEGDAVLPGVTVNIRNSQTGATRSTVTNEQGVYSLPALERGTYELSVELTG